MNPGRDTSAGASAGLGRQSQFEDVEPPKPTEPVAESTRTPDDAAPATSSTQVGQGPRSPRRVISPYPRQMHFRVRGSLVPLQTWEGAVDWVEGDEFGATLVDLSDRSSFEQTVFSRDEVTPEEADLITPGAVFRWVVARRILDTGQHTNENFLSFRKLSPWTKKELSQADARADELSRRLDDSASE